MSVHIVPHPLVQDALLRLRDIKTETEEFRRLSVRISVLLVAEALRDLPTKPATAQTPLEVAHGLQLARDVVVVPVLRAGLGMLEAVLTLLPGARVGHIGLQRDESTALASKYYAKMPGNLSEAYTILVDPMLATGGSAVAALDLIKEAGARIVRMVCIVAAPEGIALVEKTHPDVEIYTPIIDRGLNAQKYILPGLGDFGDRLYGTC
jgi:uracil phosphoribosyltransferase